MNDAVCQSLYYYLVPAEIPPIRVILGIVTSDTAVGREDKKQSLFNNNVI